MKKIILLFLICTVISVNSNSQPYKSIYGKISTEWNIFGENIAFWTWNFTICCDTTINAKQYKKIVFIGDTNCLTQYECLFISEDTINGKLWLYDSEEEKEYLTMDLNLNIGDTFKLNPNAFYLDEDSIAIVDSVYYENDSKKIRINYKNRGPADEEKLTFIEGIGPNFGVFYQENTFRSCDPPRQLLCALKDSIYVYKNKIDISEFPDTCYYMIGDGITEKNKNFRIKIFPNPIQLQEELNFIFSEVFEGSIVILNVFGSIEEKKYLQNISSYKMELCTLKKGVYLIQFLSNNSLITKKIIIQ